MRLSTKFGLWLGGFFLLFGAISTVLLYTYFRSQVEQRGYETCRQIVVEVDASQRYVREILRPTMFDLVGEDEFIPEAMSTTFVARNTVERFQEQYPDYYFKFAIDNPRNPVNLADEVEQQIIEQFEADPTLEEWRGIIERDGQSYFSVATPLRFDASCMQCHGNPADAPRSLRERYGETKGFGHGEGDIAIKSVGVPVADALATARNRTLIFAGLASLFLTWQSGLSFYLYRSLIAGPIGTLQQGAEEIRKGNLGHRVKVKAKDELGRLGTVFNSMAAQMADLVGTLEQRVAERTSDLERRSVQLEAAAQVAREAAAIRDVGQLLEQTARLISERFGFYHTGIFLVDEAGEYAVLQTASSEGGQRMLARGHRLKVGELGIVGHVAARGEPRIALDVGEDAVFFDNPDLPDTRSEMGLPLKVRERVMGVLDVQSIQEATFSDEDVAILQTLADQVALAIENAHLLEESQRALRELEALYGRRVREAWQERVTRQPPAYRYTKVGVESASSAPAPPHGPPEESGHRLVAPIRLRGQSIGSIVLRQDAEEEEQWSPEEMALIEEVSTQIGLALENARLLEETQRRAAHERLIGEVTARMRETLDVDTVLQTAVREIGEALGLHDVTIQLEMDGDWTD
jgi:GAF domain-containing protein/HAMP domain-containing protein